MCDVQSTHTLLTKLHGVESTFVLFESAFKATTCPNSLSPIGTRYLKSRLQKANSLPLFPV